MKISDLKKIKMSRLSIIKAFNYLDTRDDNIDSLKDVYVELLEKQCPTIDWRGEVYGDDIDDKVNLYDAYSEFDGVKITMSIPYMETYYEPEIYNTLDELIENNKYVDRDDVKGLKPKEEPYKFNNDEIWRDKYGRWLYQAIDSDTNTKYYYAKIIMDYENQYFTIEDKNYGSVIQSC